MPWPFSIYSVLHPKERYVWVKIRILYETDRAILVYNERKFWISKSQICGIRLRNNIFEVYVKKSTIG